MPVDAPAPFLGIKNQLVQGDEWVWLFELRSPSDGPIVGPDGTLQILRVTSRTMPAEFGTNKDTGAALVWSPWPVRMGELTDDGKANVNEIEITFGNGGMGDALLADNDYLRSHRLYIHLVHAALLETGFIAFTIPGTVIEASVSLEAVTVRLSAFALMDFTVPQRLMTRKCGFTYRGPGCSFVGDPDNAELGPCTFSLEACEQRGEWEADHGLPVLHPAFFGGYPALLAGPVFAIP